VGAQTLLHDRPLEEAEILDPQTGPTTFETLTFYVWFARALALFSILYCRFGRDSSMKPTSCHECGLTNS
jgi:hypothetical protein